ncbi:cyclopentanol dehydrogenase [Siccirubricoccus deserti]|uniref:Glucose 1-dehydrogenase n=1 Tax=Siccirubricoccus deserti TaxID=2013562 RepID=A0A9X0R0A1_9PROT|nr:glucose 1-dehydrogenase [Siccirubricoccus deserti]MBC4016387.1 glucose 1-dehydrogenase [Siccirubricoccus deserti]GGC49387.1 cyclopentanol dehydrogenase [Siccirubricoccus deserti]
MRLKDKVAIITGGAHGMGEAEARLFAKEGAAVVIADVLPEIGEAVAADINAGQGRAMFLRADVTSEMDWQRLIARTIETYGRLDILVNNAGISGSSVGSDLSLEGWNKLMSVNATGVFLGTTLAAQEMAKAGRGAIVNISSIMGFIGGAEGHPGYSASKGAVRLLTKSAAVRWGPQGVRVNSVHPGYLPAMLGGTNAGTRSAKIPLTPLRRLGEPFEVAYGVLFLASDEASFITGTELVIDGGYIAQ